MLLLIVENKCIGHFCFEHSEITVFSNDCTHSRIESLGMKDFYRFLR